MIEDADMDCHRLEPYVAQFHEADKRAAVLAEKLKTNNAVEIFFGVGVGLGGAVIGLAPFFWEMKTLYGVLTGVIGLGLTIGATVGRLVKQ